MLRGQLVTVVAVNDKACVQMCCRNGGEVTFCLYVCLVMNNKYSNRTAQKLRLFFSEGKAVFDS